MLPTQNKAPNIIKYVMEKSYHVSFGPLDDQSEYYLLNKLTSAFLLNFIKFFCRGFTCGSISSILLRKVESEEQFKRSRFEQNLCSTSSLVMSLFCLSSMKYFA